MKTVSLVAFKKWLDASLSRSERKKRGGSGKFEEKNEKSPSA
jgi:hypothetical protein